MENEDENVNMGHKQKIERMRRRKRGNDDVSLLNNALCFVLGAEMQKLQLGVLVSITLLR